MEQILNLLSQAVAEVKAAGVEEQLKWVAEADNLALLVEFYPDGVFGSFVDDSYYCWDGCGGIVRQHRSGWCRFHPEHADFDCNCNYADAEDEYYASLEDEEGDFGSLTAVDALAADEFSPEAIESIRLEERDALDALAVEEPF